MSLSELEFMKRALTLARKGVGKTAPNPAVGCVIVKNGEIIAEGWHRKAGTPHAEIHALQMAGKAASGADVYVTLEPCCHYGKTPPCCDALIKAGVRRVVAATLDPFKPMAGRGIQKLRHAGIRVDLGLMEDECRELNRGFIKAVTTGMPYVILKTAMTLDGFIATETGHSRWITSETSRRTVHRLRSCCDAVMVGVDTVIADNPDLTVRHVKGGNPLRVIVDTGLRTPPDSSLVSTARVTGTLIATCDADPARQKIYTEQGVQFVVCAEQDGKVQLTALLRKLVSMGRQTLLVEAGGLLAGELLKQGLIDECIFFYAPKIIGGGIAPFNIKGIEIMDQAFCMEVTRMKRSGPDFIVHVRPVSRCSQG